MKTVETIYQYVLNQRDAVESQRSTLECVFTDGTNRINLLAYHAKIDAYNDVLRFIKLTTWGQNLSV